jgi:homogentisate 1,2-dioxygenase
MFETRMPIRLTPFASQTILAQPDYDNVWSGFAKARLPVATAGG